MKVMWLGQNGLLFDFDGITIMIDPYLTDSLSSQDSSFTRKIKINKKVFSIKPNVIILTTGHLDHADNESLEKLLKSYGKKKRPTVLSCESVFEDIITIPSIADANHIMFEKYSEWTVKNINIRAVPARTDDRTAFGVILTDLITDKKYYVAGDTLYNTYVIENLPSDIYASFIPINGEFGSMNVTDAKRFAKDIKTRFCVPVHFGMFDNVDATLFDLPNAIIPAPYKIINFEDYETTISNPFDNIIESFSIVDTESVTETQENAIKTEEVKDDNIVIAEVNDDQVEVIDEEIDNKNTENVEDVGDIKDVEDSEYVEDTEDVEDSEYAEDTEDVEDSEYAEDIEDVEDSENVEDIEDAENIEDVEDSENVEDIEDAENIEDVEDSENVEDIEDAEDVEDSEYIVDVGDNDEDNDSDNGGYDELVTETDNDNDNSSNDIGCETTDDNGDGDDEVVTEMNDSDKIDAFIKEFEKFERGEATDFSKIK